MNFLGRDDRIEAAGNTKQAAPAVRQACAG